MGSEEDGVAWGADVRIGEHRVARGSVELLL